jgi:hypothetical protein
MEEGPEEGPWRIPAEAVVVRLAKIIGTTSDELLSAAWRLRDEVSEAQKQELARPKAKELAERLADKVRIQLKNGKTMTEVIKQETTTADDEPLVVKTTLDFTWLTRRFTPQRFGQQPQGPPVFFSSVPGLGVQTENNDFMETVFGMKLGDVGIVANADKSIYYVVRIAERTPSDEDGRAANRETFFDQNVFGNQQYQFLAAGDAITSLNQWTEQFLEKYEVKFKEDADGDDS